MDDLAQSRTASVLTVLAGLWLALSPIWISVTGWALAGVIAVGSFMALMGLFQLFVEDTLPSWLVGIAAIWLAISAYVFDIGNSAIWNQIVTAIVTFVLATWDGFEISQVQHQHQS